MASADLIMKLRRQDDLTKTINGVKAELSDTEKKAAKLDLIKKEFDRIKDSSMPLKRQLRQVKALLGEMNMQGLNKNDLFMYKFSLLFRNYNYLYSSMFPSS